jgi:hypothetical protein
MEVINQIEQEVYSRLSRMIEDAEAIERYCLDGTRHKETIQGVQYRLIEILMLMPPILLTEQHKEIRQAYIEKIYS